MGPGPNKIQGSGAVFDRLTRPSAWWIGGRPSSQRRGRGDGRRLTREEGILAGISLRSGAPPTGWRPSPVRRSGILQATKRSLWCSRFRRALSQVSVLFEGSSNSD